MAAFNFQPGNFMLSQEAHHASHHSRPSNITLWFFFSWDLNGNFISDHVSRLRNNKGFSQSRSALVTSSEPSQHPQDFYMFVVDNTDRAK